MRHRLLTRAARKHTYRANVLGQVTSHDREGVIAGPHHSVRARVYSTAV